MAVDGPFEKDWQSFRTLNDCNRYMLTNEIGCDITFLVGKERHRVSAHKYVLASRSCVFFAMFYGPAAESGNEIEVPDVEPDTFSLLFRWVINHDRPIFCQTNKLHLDTSIHVLIKYKNISQQPQSI